MRKVQCGWFHSRTAVRSLMIFSVRSSSSTCQSYPFKFHRRLDGSATATNLTAVSECVSRAAPVVGSGLRRRRRQMPVRVQNQRSGRHSLLPFMSAVRGPNKVAQINVPDVSPQISRDRRRCRRRMVHGGRHGAHGYAGVVHCSGSRVQSCHLSSSPPCHWRLTVAGLARSCQLASALNT